RVVLAEDRHRRPRGAARDRGAERRRHAADPALHLEPVPLQELAEPGAGLRFLVAELRVVVDLAGELVELVAQPVDRALDLVLDGAHRTSSGGEDRRGDAARRTERSLPRRTDPLNASARDAAHPRVTGRGGGASAPCAKMRSTRTLTRRRPAACSTVPRILRSVCPAGR